MTGCAPLPRFSNTTNNNMKRKLLAAGIGLLAWPSLLVIGLGGAHAGTYSDWVQAHNLPGAGTVSVAPSVPTLLVKTGIAGLVMNWP